MVNNNPIPSYLSEINKALKAGTATEHTHRPALKDLIEAIAASHELDVTATNQPKQEACGAPDYVVTANSIPLGHIEAKDVGKNLDKAEKTEQLKRYLDGLPNLILTDYLEFRWYVFGEHRMTAALDRDTGDGAEEVGNLIAEYLKTKIKPTFPIYHPNSWKSYHFPTAKGTVSPMQPSDGMILVIGPRLEGHSVIFLAIQTHLSCRFLLAVDSLGLRRSGSSSQIINQAQDFPEQVPRHRHLSQLERNVAAMSDNLGPDLHQLVAQRRHRPVLHLLRQSQCPHEVAQIVGQGVKLEPNGIVAELAT